jgi:hypothetical protein
MDIEHDIHSLRDGVDSDWFVVTLVARRDVAIVTWLGPETVPWTVRFE